TRYARVVFPVPGGPHMMTELGGRSPSWGGSTNRFTGEPGSKRWSWPTTSSIDAGRMRTASGARGSTCGRPEVSVAAESKRSTFLAYDAALTSLCYCFTHLLAGNVSAHEHFPPRCPEVRWRGCRRVWLFGCFLRFGQVYVVCHTLGLGWGYVRWYGAVCF